MNSANAAIRDRTCPDPLAPDPADGAGLRAGRHSPAGAARRAPIRTKIIATLGPASSYAAMIRRLVQAGCDVFRLNFSHGANQEREETLFRIRAVERELAAPVAVMADLCGPKIRVSPIEGGTLTLLTGQECIIRRHSSPAPSPAPGRHGCISTTLPELVEELACGETLLLDEGRIRLEVTQVHPPDEVVCTVRCGGLLAGGKGVNLPRTTLRLLALTDKDRADVAWIARHDIDFVALSFARTAEDVQALRSLLAELHSPAQVIAKIEKPQALDNLPSIIGAADGVMVARGDLGVEMDLLEVPVAQKQIAHLCQQYGKPCIVATQMLESMTTAMAPTRAEVSDVANAVLDHADAVMLSGETAVGRYPSQAVAVMNGIVNHVQSFHDGHNVPVRLWPPAVSRLAAALAAAVREIIAVEDIAAVAAFTVSGATALMMAKSRLPVPILGISPAESAVRRMCLYYGVEPALAPVVEHTRDVLDIASKLALSRGIAASGDKIIVISGRPICAAGNTNTLVVHTIP